jgi:hypothetical protein
LDEAPLYLVAAGQNGREGEDENILDRISYSGVPTSINLLDPVHTILKTGEVMLEGKPFSLIGQFLDGAEEGGLGAGDFIREIRCGGFECQRVGLFCGEGNLDGSIPEWKEFIKIAGFGGVA